MLRGPFDFLIDYMVRHAAFWCVGVPVALMFAAYLAGIVVMCVKELWSIQKSDRKRRGRHEEADPDL